MIEPSHRTLRRRFGELHAAAERERERERDEDTAALLIFYAAECALKAAYLDRHQFRDTSSANAYAQAARSFGHDLLRLIEALNIPATAVGPLPTTMLQRSKTPFACKALHEAWRYGEKVSETSSIHSWLSSIVEWARKSA